MGFSLECSLLEVRLLMAALLCGHYVLCGTCCVLVHYWTA